MGGFLDQQFTCMICLKLRSPHGDTPANPFLNQKNRGKLERLVYHDAVFIGVDDGRHVGVNNNDPAIFVGNRARTSSRSRRETPRALF